MEPRWPCRTRQKHQGTWTRAWSRAGRWPEGCRGESHKPLQGSGQARHRGFPYVRWSGQGGVPPHDTPGQFQSVLEFHMCTSPSEPALLPTISVGSTIFWSLEPTCLVAHAMSSNVMDRQGQKQQQNKDGTRNHCIRLILFHCTRLILFHCIRLMLFHCIQLIPFHCD
jgi:hypothetical protein